MQDKKTRVEKPLPRMFQFPTCSRASDSEKTFNDQSLKKLLRKNKEILRLSKPLEFPQSSHGDTRESQQESEQPEEYTGDILDALVFGARLMKEKARVALDPQINLMSVLVKDREEPPEKVEVDESR